MGIFSKLFGLLLGSKTGSAAVASAPGARVGGMRPPASAPSDWDKALLMAKEAVQFKETDLPRAIQLLKEASSLSPTNTDIAFRLARYLRLSGKNDEAFAIYGTLTRRLDLNDILSFGYAREAILEEMTKQLFEEENYRYFVYYSLQVEWMRLLGLSSQGMLRPDWNPVFILNTRSKVGRAFVALGLKEQIDEINARYASFLSLFRQSFERMSAISDSQRFARPTHHDPTQQSIGDTWSIVLRENEEYMQLFNSLSSGHEMDRFYKEHIAPRLGQSSDSPS